MQFSSEDELLDFVDEKDNVICVKKRSEIYANCSPNFRAVNVFLKNNNGKIWIPRRVKTKKLFPLSLDSSIAGHVKSGETYLQAFERELKEEANLDLQKMEYKILGHLNPYVNNVSAFQTVYEISYNNTPDYNKEDFVGYYWLTPDEILEKIKKGEKHKSDLPKLIEIFYK